MQGRSKIEALQELYDNVSEFQRKYNDILLRSTRFEILHFALAIDKELKRLKQPVECAKCSSSFTNEYGQWCCKKHQKHLVFEKTVCDDYEPQHSRCEDCKLFDLCYPKTTTETQNND